MTTADQPLDDPAVARRVAVYATAAALHATLGQVWTRAEPELVEVIRAHWLEVLAREAGDARTNAAIADDLIEITRRRWISPVDTAWIQALAQQGSRLHQLALPMCDIADNIARLNIRLGERISRHFADDLAFATTAVQALQWLALAEFEVMSAALGALRQAEIARKLTGLCSDYRVGITTILEDGLSRSARLRTLTDQTGASMDTMLRNSFEVASAAEQSATAMDEAARTAAQLIEAIGAARRQVEETAGIVARAAQEADRSMTVGETLSDHAAAIGSIVEVIRDIAQQTNLLALNATIEAARAGDAGRGFAVVASEVKTLSSRTTSAIDDAAAKVAAIQEVTRQSVNANQAIDSVVDDVEQSSAQIQDAMQRQAETVTAITAAIDETALAAASTANAIGSVRSGAETVAGDVASLLEGFEALDEQLKLIDRTTVAFLDRVGAWAR